MPAWRASRGRAAASARATSARPARSIRTAGRARRAPGRGAGRHPGHRPPTAVPPGAIPQQRRPSEPPPRPAVAPGPRRDNAAQRWLATVPPFGTPPYGRSRFAPQHPVVPPAPAAAPAPPRNGFGVAALCLGLVGLPFALVPLTGVVAAVLGALAVVFGLLGRARVRRGVATGRAMPVAGAVLGVVALAAGVAGTVLLVRSGASLTDELRRVVPSASSAAVVAPAGLTAAGMPGYTFRITGDAPAATVTWSVDGRSGTDRTDALPWDRTVVAQADGFGTTALTATTAAASGTLTCTIVGEDGRVLDTRTSGTSVTCSALG